MWEYRFIINSYDDFYKVKYLVEFLQLKCTSLCGECYSILLCLQLKCTSLSWGGDHSIMFTVEMHLSLLGRWSLYYVYSWNAPLSVV